ncbi:MULTISPECIES: hypothetical protein [unclassified Yoonia]|uniref:hypothetical protein n=1 Tax=unclassified Yoonia TaxID=2629118 RepID=UPI002AFF009C|nr:MULTISPECIES: hypothetical protein [unclassified Yoonia]
MHKISFAKGPAEAKIVKVLVVGDVARWKQLGRLRDDLSGFCFVDMGELDHQKIKQIAPDLIISPLVATGFDAVDVARRLRAAAFAGRYCAVVDDVPNPEIIRQEIRSIAPELDFDLLVFPRNANAAAGSG